MKIKIPFLLTFLPFVYLSNVFPQDTDTLSISTSTEIVQEDNRQEIVFVTKSGTEYHREGCKYLSESKIERKLVVAEPVYEPCGVCKPPLLHIMNSEKTKLSKDSVYEKSGNNRWLTLAVGSGWIKEAACSNLFHLNIRFGTFSSDRSEVLFLVGIGKVDSTDKAEKRMYWLNLGGKYKYFLTPGYTFSGIYVSAGLGFNLASIPIGSGYLMGFDLNTALGLNIVQIKSLRIGAELSPGVTFFQREDFEGNAYDKRRILYIKYSILFSFQLGS